MILDEEEAVRQRFWHPGAGDVVLDVGSFEGAYTIPALEAGAKVYAVDGREETLDLIADHPNLVRVHAALFDGGAYPPELLDGIANGPFESSRSMVPDAPWRTVDQLCAKFDRLDWLKIDVEGGELGVLLGAEGTLERLRPRVLVEDHSRVYSWTARQDTTRRILDLLNGFGYQTEILAEPAVDYVYGAP